MARHSHGEWYGVVTPAGVAILSSTVPPATVEQVWRDLRAGNGLGAVIDGLVGAFGTSLSTLPAFGVLSLAEASGVRVAMRGDVEAHLWLSGEAEPVIVSGLGVTTWNERALGGVDRAELVVPGSSGDSLLPVMDGIVRTGRLVVSLVESDTEPGPPGGARTASAAAPDVSAPKHVAPPVPTPTLVEPTPGPVASGPVPAPMEMVSPEVPPPIAPASAPAVEPEVIDQAGLAAEEPGLEAVGPAQPEAGAPDGIRSAETMVADEVPNEYDQLLYGETVLSSVEAAAVRLDEPGLTTTGPPEPGPGGMIASLPPFPAAPAPPAATPPAPALGDHDGETVLVEQLHLLQAAAQAPVLPAQSPAPIREYPQLLIGDRPPVRLDRSAIVGTRPRLSRVQGGNAPHLVSVDSPSGEISRSHVELRVEGFAVLAVDLDSTNGTTLLRVGSDPVRLHPGDPNLLVPGDRIDLGDDVVLCFEGLA